jgi:hypothetical protein
MPGATAITLFSGAVSLARLAQAYMNTIIGKISGNNKRFITLSLNRYIEMFQCFGAKKNPLKG